MRCAIVANAEDSRCRIVGVRVRLPRREELSLIFIALPVFAGRVFDVSDGHTLLIGTKIYKEVM